MPSIEKLRMVNFGTEATMSCIRLARGTTNRNIIIKFVVVIWSCRFPLVKAGSGLQLSVPDSPGIPEELSKLTITIPYNDNDAVKEVNKHAKDIAAVIVEPILEIWALLSQ